MAENHSTVPSSFVYFALGVYSGLCKIGKSDDPFQRLVDLRDEIREKLALHHFIATNDGLWLEAKFHAFFAHKRLANEWFNLDKDDLDQVRTMHACDRLIVKGREFNAEPLALPQANALHASASDMGKKGGAARANVLSAQRRREIARMGGLARQQRRKPPEPPLTANPQP